MPVSTTTTDALATYNRFFPATLEIETIKVLLRLMKEDDFAALQKIAAPAIIWKYFPKELNNGEELRKWIADGLREREEGKRMPFVIIDKDTNEVCGCTSIMNISFYDKRIEIGGTWLGVDTMGTNTNRNAKFALLSYAFEAMKMERVEFKTDNLNERSKAALRKIGATEEGIFRNHMQMHSNRRRDSIYFSIIQSEWEEVKKGFFGDMI